MDRNKPSRRMRISPNCSSRIWMAAYNVGLWQLDLADLEVELKRLFEPYGKLRKLVVKKSKDRKYCFAFLEYGTEEEANAAIKALDQYEMGGKKMKV